MKWYWSPQRLDAHLIQMSAAHLQVCQQAVGEGVEVIQSALYPHQDTNSR